MGQYLKADLARAAEETRCLWEALSRMLGRQANVPATPLSEGMLFQVVRGFAEEHGKSFPSNNEVRHLKQWSLHWAQYGFPVFSITHSLESALLLTDCSGVRGEDFVWPFDSFLIELPSRGALSFLGMDGDTEVPARYVLAHRFWTWNSQEDAAPFERAPRAPSVHLDPRVDTSVPSVLLGTEVKLPREMRDAAKAYVEQGRSAERRASWELHSRFAVRGHWRNQPVGPRPDGRTRRQWIRPYWKGPEDAAMIGRTYQTRLAGEGDVR